jgi:hypothetical protein
VSVAAVAWNLGGPGLAASIDVRERDDDRTISREHAPATTDYILSDNSVGYTH